MKYPEEIYHDRVKVLETALEKIAAEVSIPVRSDKQMYDAWRAVAVKRIDIARAALAGKAEQ